MATVARRWYCDLDSMTLTASISERRPLDRLDFINHDKMPIGIQFYRQSTGQAELLPAGTTLSFGAIKKADFGGDLLFSITSWTDATTTNASGQTDTDFYIGTLLLNTTEIDAELVDPAPSLDCWTELELDLEGTGNRTTTTKVDTTIWNDVLRGQGSPTAAADPSLYVLKSQGINYYPTLTGLTGGTATDLDSIATTTISVPYMVTLIDDAGPYRRDYELVSGTDAESSPDTIRPDDYAASTNEKVWKLRDPSVSAGEANTASALTADANVYKQKTGVDLEFRGISAGSTKITITQNATDIDIDANGGLILDGEVAGNGLVTRTAAETYTNRTLTGTSGEIDVSNGDGVSGNPTIGVADNITLPGTEGINMAGGTTGQRPGVPIEGDLRRNTTDNSLEYYNGTSWVDLTDTSAGTGNYRNVWLPAKLWTPDVTAGPAATTTELTTGVTLYGLAYDDSTAEYAFMGLVLEEAWNLSTIKYKVYWTSRTASSGDCYWRPSIQLFSDGDDLDVTWPAGNAVIDTITGADFIQISSATTLSGSGSASAGSWLSLKMERLGSSGSDTMTGDGLFLGLMLQYQESTTPPSAW